MELSVDFRENFPRPETLCQSKAKLSLGTTQVEREEARELGRRSVCDPEAVFNLNCRTDLTQVESDLEELSVPGNSSSGSVDPSSGSPDP